MISSQQQSKTPLEKQQTARIITGSFVLLTAFLGACFVQPHPQSYWFYTQLMSLSDAFIAFWLCWYLYKKHNQPTNTTLWHQFLHWCGTLMTIYAITVFISSGLISAHQARLVTMTILALSFFIAGVHSDTQFILLGITLGAMACLIPTAHNNQILYASGIAIIGLILAIGLSLYQKKHSRKTPDDAAETET